MEFMPVCAAESVLALGTRASVSSSRAANSGLFSNSCCFLPAMSAEVQTAEGIVHDTAKLFIQIIPLEDPFRHCWAGNCRSRSAHICVHHASSSEPSKRAFLRPRSAREISGRRKRAKHTGALEIIRQNQQVATVAL